MLDSLLSYKCLLSGWQRFLNYGQLTKYFSSMQVGMGKGVISLKSGRSVVSCQFIVAVISLIKTVLLKMSCEISA